MNRRGVTIVELLITLVVFGILGTALARLMISNSRYVSRQEALLEARQTARAAMNVMLPEFRMVSDGGLDLATPDSVVVRVPYAFGVFCRNEFAILAPPDSVVYATATPGGIGYQLPSGLYAFDASVTVTGTTSSTTDCDADSIRAIPGGMRVTLSVSNVAPPGRLFYLYQGVKYVFRASSALPGRVALWRHVFGNAAEELLAPFDTASGFRFLVGSRLTPQSAVPSPLSAVRGLELRLIGASINPPQGTSEPTTFVLQPRVRFGNMLVP